MNSHLGKIPHEEWLYHGMPGHFTGSARCCFHIVTDIGRVRVSTIGCYHEKDAPVNYDTRVPIGSGKNDYYETAVFVLTRWPSPHPAEAQTRVHSWGSIDLQRYASELEASIGHQATCDRWADRERNEAAYVNATTGDPE